MRSNLRKKRGCLKNRFETPPRSIPARRRRSAQQTGVPVITSKNAAQLNQVVTNLIEATDEIASKDKSKE